MFRRCTFTGLIFTTKIRTILEHIIASESAVILISIINKKYLQFTSKFCTDYLFSAYIVIYTHGVEHEYITTRNYLLMKVTFLMMILQNKQESFVSGNV